MGLRPTLRGFRGVRPKPRRPRPLLKALAVKAL